MSYRAASPRQSVSPPPPAGSSWSVQDTRDGRAHTPVTADGWFEARKQASIASGVPIEFVSVTREGS